MAFQTDGTEIHTGMVPLQIVWGNPLIPQDKTNDDGVKVLKDGVVVQQYVFGVAIPKDHFTTAIWPAMGAEIAKGFPSGAPSNFAYKYKDGDDAAPGPNGSKPYREREGHPGCYILTVSTEIAPAVWKRVNGGFVQLKQGEIKTGDYVAMGLNFKLNIPDKANRKPSLYVNPTAIELVGIGTAIVTSGPADPNKVLGAVSGYALPAGVSAPGAAPAMMPGGPPLPGAAPMLPPAVPGAVPMMPPAPVAAPPPPPPPAGPQRPVDPSHIHLAGQPGEMWFLNGAWTPAPVAAPAVPAPPLPPPAAGFATPGAMPGLPPAVPGAIPMPGR